MFGAQGDGAMEGAEHAIICMFGLKDARVSANMMGTLNISSSPFNEGNAGHACSQCGVVVRIWSDRMDGTEGVEHCYTSFFKAVEASVGLDFVASSSTGLIPITPLP
ncbi:uncharacterized protein LOC110006673 [Amborella trichopoda]|uniref:uncharacterized protein LOC110006673 n=1 Tax=Amborella trichopoda TaxID=13333 RepID=UPI0009BC955A|nr:uncharacterized protein LOC110006673 [Amborella trichopoda]|eukprot:XP_020518708.1 uncharacterized protein LOC110006673 [Amborella trichopoda]